MKNSCYRNRILGWFVGIIIIIHGTMFVPSDIEEKAEETKCEINTGELK